MYTVIVYTVVLEISNAKIKHSILATVCYLLHCYGTIQCRQTAASLGSANFNRQRYQAECSIHVDLTADSR